VQCIRMNVQKFPNADPAGNHEEDTEPSKSPAASLPTEAPQDPWGPGGLVDQTELHRAAPTAQDPRNCTPMDVPYLTTPPGGVRLGVGRQLLIDDFLIEFTTMTRVFHQPVKYPGNPVLFPETAWERNDALPPTTIPKCGGVWFDPQDDRFKMWYMASYLGQMALATSRDGIHWERPELDVVAGSNLVLPEDIHPDSGTVWIDPNPGDVSERFKLFVREPNPIGKGRFGALLFTSGDGVHWQKVGQTGPMGDRSTLFHNPFRDRWVQSIRASRYPRQRLRLHWEDQDFVTSGAWQEGEPQFWCAADCMDQGGTTPPQLYNLDAVAYESVVVGLFQILKGPPNLMGEATGLPKLTELVLATSRDGFHWHRPDRTPFLAARREPGSWEYGYVESTGGVLLVVGDELWFYYSAYAGDPNRLEGTWHVNGMYANGATGLAKLRRDGFASLQCRIPEAEMITRPLLFDGRHLFVNANTAGRSLRVECLNHEGLVVPGFSAEECIAWCGNSTKVEIGWKNASLAQLAGSPVKFRFLLDAGEIYSFWVAADAQGASRGYLGAGGPGWSGWQDL
jgi:hypothetical protein